MPSPARVVASLLAGCFLAALRLSKDPIAATKHEYHARGVGRSSTTYGHAVEA